MFTDKEIIKQIDQDGRIYEVAIIKERDIKYFKIDVEASKDTPYHLRTNEIIFRNDYIIDKIITLAETNALAGFFLNIDGKFYPNECYFLDASNNIAQQPIGTNWKGFYCSTSLFDINDIWLEINKDGRLQFWLYNTHSSAQELYIWFFGFNVYRKVLREITFK